MDFSLVDTNGTIHPYASDRLDFELTGDALFMGGWNSGVFGEMSPIGKNFVNLECGRARVFVKAGRTPGKATLKWKMAGARVSCGHDGEIELELKPVEVNNGLMAKAQRTLPANGRTFARKTDAPFVQDLATGRSAGGEKYKVFVNGAEVKFPKGLGAPVKFDDNTGVSCAYVPVLEALRAAGAKLEFVHEPKRIPASKKWLRKLSPTPFVPMVTVKAGGREIDACAGFTELFVDNGKDKNLTNCEIYRAREKSPVVCGELVSLVGYIPGVKANTDTKKKRVCLEVR